MSCGSSAALELKEGAIHVLVTLIVVSDHAEERRVLANFDRWAARVAGPLAPVLDMDGLPLRIASALSRAGCRVRIQDLSKTMEELQYEDAEARRPTTPSLVIAGGTVDPAVVELASRMCGTHALPFTNVEAATRTLTNENRTALVLFEPERTHATELVEVLRVLAQERVEVGIIYTSHPIEARYALLKSLLVSEIEGQGEFAILSPYAETQEGCAPAALQNTARGPTTFTHTRDLLVLIGHANPIDANFGSELVLCGRLGAGPVAPDERDASYPCHASNDCFRQPIFGRGTHETTGLVRITDADARVLVLSGCSVGAFGRAWFAARRGLAFQSHQSPALAAVVTTANVLRRTDLDFLFPALLAAGYTLGGVVNMINSLRGSELHQVSPLGLGVGPFVILGNPCLRLSGIPIHHLNAQRQTQDRLIINLGSVRPDAVRGTLLRVPNLELSLTAYLVSTEFTKERFCLGVVVPEDGARTLYLWLAATRGGWPNELEFDIRDTDPSESLVAALEHFLSQLAFWLIYLEEYACMYQAAPVSADQFRRALAALPGIANLLSKAANAVRHRSGAVTNGTSLRQLQNAVWSRLCAMASSLLNASLEVAALFGTVQAYGWEARFRRLDPTGPFDKCMCGDSALYGRRYRFLDGGRLERVQYQCAACGPVGEDDGRRLLGVNDVPSNVTSGSLIECTCHIRAPASELVHIRAVAVLEAWRKDRRMFGETNDTVIAPGQEKTFVLSVAVPADLAPGVYPFAVFAVINGALVIRRRFVEVATVS